MVFLSRLLMRLAEVAVWLPTLVVRVLVINGALNPRLGALRYVLAAGIGYVAFALLLVYVVAPLRGIVGAHYLSDKLRYDAERWLATAIYDSSGAFVGTFDPRLDSQRDVNYTEAAIEIGDYVANPDHKSIPVRETPPHYWNCLVWHEDRYLGGPLNPYGIDLLGVLKIPYSTLRRSLALKRPSLGVGGSTLPMQFARVIYKTPPSASEGGLAKLRRKIGEWWLAPVIFHELTRDGDFTPLKQWAANHIWLAQRTGGQPLHGVEVTSRIVFGKEAKDLSTAEQFVLASAVNKPIILLAGNERLNEVRLDRWRYITEVRARTCAERLISDPEEQRKVVFELIGLAGGPPDPRVRPRLQEALERHAPALARRAQANPVIRANALLPQARFGLREEMKQTWGFNWRAYARGVTTTLDITHNLAFGAKVSDAVARIAPTLEGRLHAGWTLDLAGAGATGARTPGIVVVAADHKGEIVRYFETGETAPYFGSSPARSRDTGLYDAARESRAIASTGKILAAIALANEGRDEPGSLYLDTQAPEKGLETCERNGTARHGRKAIVAFACSLNAPLINRTALAGQERMRRLVDGFGFAMPPANAEGEGTPPSTAAVLGLVSGSPRRVHQMSATVLAAMLGQPGPVRPPTLVKRFDYTVRDLAENARQDRDAPLDWRKLIRRDGVPFLKSVLQAPLCYTHGGASHGTLKSAARWCAARRPDLALHFAKTGTHTTADPNATVDTWITGGIQFATGAAYSYVVLVGTGSTAEPWARSVHAAQITPLLDALLDDLAGHAKAHPAPGLLPRTPVAATAANPLAADTRLQSNEAERKRIFERN